MKKIISILIFISYSTLGHSYSDPLFFKQWAFNNTDHANPGIGAAKAHKLTKKYQKETIIVAVIDSGVDYTHPDIDANMWINQNEIPENGIDDDQNGHIDDVYGIDLIDRDSDPMDQEGHGSHVAGIIAAEIDNKIGIAGIATHVKIMAIRAIPNSGDEKDEDIIKALMYAAENGARIINCSFSKNNSSDLVKETIDLIHDKYDVLVVTAAGNNHYDIDLPGNESYPANFQNDNLLTVASVSKFGAPSFFSNWGQEKVDIFAPGSIIYSLDLNHNFESENGTSQAAPQISGVAAEILSLFPYLKAIEVKSAILKSAIINNFTDGKARTNGVVDMVEAIKNAAKI